MRSVEQCVFVSWEVFTEQAKFQERMLGMRHDCVLDSVNNLTEDPLTCALN